MTINNVITIFMTVIFVQFYHSKAKLQFVVETFRHGARGPIYDIWNAESFGQWEELEPAGMRQHYILGQSLREKYINQFKFLSPFYNFTELVIRSTDVNRTLQSAQAQLSGLYPLGTGPSLQTEELQKIAVPPYEGYTNPFEEGDLSALHYKQQVFPIHTQNESTDFLLCPYEFSACPINQYLEEIQTNSTFMNTIDREFQFTYAELSRIMNITNVTSDVVKQYYDIFENDIYGAKPLPAGLYPSLWKNITFIATLIQQFITFGNPITRQLTNTYFMNNLIAKFDAKIAGQTEQKWDMFSAHDTTIMFLQNGFNISNWECLWEVWTTNQTTQKQCYMEYPVYASNFIVELHEDDENKGNFYVQAFFQGKPIKLCDSESYVCEYQDFRQRLVNYVLPDFLSVCNAEFMFAGPSQKKHMLQSRKNFLGKEHNSNGEVFFTERFLLISFLLVQSMLIAYFILRLRRINKNNNGALNYEYTKILID